MGMTQFWGSSDFVPDQVEPPEVSTTRRHDGFTWVSSRW